MTINVDWSSDFVGSLVDNFMLPENLLYVELALHAYSQCRRARCVFWAVILPICTGVMLILGLVNLFKSLVVILRTSYHFFARTRFIRKVVFVCEGPMLKISKVRSMFTNEGRFLISFVPITC